MAGNEISMKTRGGLRVALLYNKTSLNPRRIAKMGRFE